jgi:glutathione synthase/RimK-type ligase-like ATP-grasp enzyme
MKYVALATSEKFAGLTDDDALLLEPLAERDLHAEAAVWSDPCVRWTDYDGVILRSCWDYHLRLSEFLRWISELNQSGIRVLNPPAMIRWNADKTYLRELEGKGVPVIPTFWPEKRVRLGDKLRGLGWNKAVIKPCVSATAHRTMLVSVEDADKAQPLLDELIGDVGGLVQQFVDSVQTRGEWSLMFFAGEFSHAVIKTPKAGDFRVQHDFGGSEQSAEPPDFVLQGARRVISAVEGVPLYARVDGVEDDGRFLLMELELIEPALFLSLHTAAAERFAAAIAKQFVVP